VPEIKFTEEDEQEIQRLVEKYDPDPIFEAEEDLHTVSGSLREQLTDEIRKDIARHARAGLILRHVVEILEPEERREMLASFSEALGALGNRVYNYAFLSEEMLEKLGNGAWQAKYEALDGPEVTHETV
jgi:hypothetical protein